MKCTAAYCVHTAASATTAAAANAFVLFQNPNALPGFFLNNTVKRRNSKSNQTLVHKIPHDVEGAIDKIISKKSNPSMMPALLSPQPLSMT